MSRRFFLGAILAVAVAMGAHAQAFTVSYLDGTVELQSAKGWTEIAIGDKVPQDATVRISLTGSLELLRARTRITILKDGVYSIATLTAAAGTAAPGSV